MDDLDEMDLQQVRVDPFVHLSDQEFLCKYRFTKRFGGRVVDLIRNQLELPYASARGFPLSPQLQVACALRCWARHEIQDDTGDLHGVSQPVVSNVCAKVATALASLRPHFIKMPRTLDECEANIAKFRRISNFPMVTNSTIRSRRQNNNNQSCQERIAEANLNYREKLMKMEQEKHAADMEIKRLTIIKLKMEIEKLRKDLSS